MGSGKHPPIGHRPAGNTPLSQRRPEGFRPAGQRHRVWNLERPPEPPPAPAPQPVREETTHEAVTRKAATVQTPPQGITARMPANQAGVMLLRSVLRTPLPGDSGTMLVPMFKDPAPSTADLARFPGIPAHVVEDSGIHQVTPSGRIEVIGAPPPPPVREHDGIVPSDAAKKGEFAELIDALSAASDWPSHGGMPASTPAPTAVAEVPKQIEVPQIVVEYRTDPRVTVLLAVCMTALGFSLLIIIWLLKTSARI